MDQQKKIRTLADVAVAELNVFLWNCHEVHGGDWIRTPERKAKLQDIELRLRSLTVAIDDLLDA